MLLSLPSPNVLCIKELNDTFAKFTWCGKPPKWTKEILEGEFYHGGLRLSNISLFDKALKLSWLKRYLRSSGKWTVFPNDFELWDVFKYGPDYLVRILELTSNAVLSKEPIWLNPDLSIHINREWLSKGISTIADFLGTMNIIMPME